MRRRTGIFLVVAVLAAAASAAWFLLAAGTSGPVPAYRTAKVEKGPIASVISASGTLGALVTVEVGSQLSGQIAELYADFNSIVTQGQLLARIDTRLLDARLHQADADLASVRAALTVARAQGDKAQAEVATARAGIANAETQVARAELALRDAERDRRRRRELGARGVAPTTDLERAESAAQAAQAQLASARAQAQAAVAGETAAQAASAVAEAQVLVAQANVAQKEAAVRQVQVDIDRSSIRAPIDGVVVDRAVSVGQTVASSLQAPKLFIIAEDLQRMLVLANVAEADIGRVEAEQPVTFTVSAYSNDTFDGRVVQVRLAPQDQQNVVTYIVVIAVDNPDRKLLPGMTANVRVVADQRPAALKVPNAALRFRPAGAATPAPAPGRRAGGAPEGQVWVIGADGMPVGVPVRLGIGDGGTTEVVAAGLEEGQEVIIGLAPKGAQPARPRLGF